MPLRNKKPTLPPDNLPWDWLVGMVSRAPRRPKPEWEVVLDGKVFVRGEAYNASLLLASCLKQLPKNARVEIRRV